MFSQAVRYFEMLMALVYVAAGFVVLFGDISLFENLSGYELYLISGGLIAYGTYRVYRSYKLLKESREENGDDEE
ncbi:MAG: hypothetical protein IPI12_03385 [Ignavibacteriales bacterium]|nr:hypothetical protein [Ignavibacteriales bacterium]MBK7265382.1 hypothetical protein [Ignavibacteriales bacterium]MBK8663144.1 hypothetical protein [Ignavibacteriales bacterium]MBP7542713.1 hypothetical protein [Ignavibacteriaceae bacterium]MBP9124014.1 hypothetical protein [Ignavibacteriaceae bacterium]